MGKKFIVAILVVLSYVSTQAQTSKKSTQDPDNLAKDYFSQIMGARDLWQHFR